MSISEERWTFLGRIGKQGGRLGGKRSLETVTRAARIAQAYNAGVQGGRPVRIDHAKVLELRDAGEMGREIAADLGISEPSVWRIPRQAGKKRSR